MKQPIHVAIIMDGNGRYGIKKFNNRNKGHYKGLINTFKIIEYCIKIKINFLTLYTFSNENWLRPKKEIDNLFKLFRYFYVKKFHLLNKQNVIIKFIGSRNNLPKDIKKIIKAVEKKTKKNKGMLVCFALNYGSRQEIIKAFNKKCLIKLKIDEKFFSNLLYTKEIPYPDLLIRTGGYQRLSNFLLWQLSYSELFFLKKTWPEFRTRDLDKILDQYYLIRRNFGGISE